MTSFVKVVQNVLGQSVFSVKLAGQSDFVMQPDLSFNAGDVYTFDISDPSMSGYSLVFGTEVDVSSSIVSTYTTVNGTTITLNIPSGYIGQSLVYFEDSSAGMGYVEATSVNFLSDWEKLGDDIDGEAAKDQFGYSVCLSSDGRTVAIGGRTNDGNDGYQTSRGHVRVYYYDETNTWTQFGQDIDGEQGSLSGANISLSSDGHIVAIGANGIHTNGPWSGHVRIYKYSNDETSTWTQLGQDIEGETTNELGGSSVSLSSDGYTVAIGAYENDEKFANSGCVRIYRYSNDTWTKLGSNIDGEADGDYSGYSVSLSSDGHTVAIGAYLNDGNGLDSGHVRIYRYSNDTWTPLGSDIYGEAADDWSGRSVSLSSDGHTVAIGAIKNDGINGVDSGHVRIYRYSNETWTQLGSDIDGEAAYYRSGWSVSLSSDGHTVAFRTNSNSVRIYRYSNDTWTQVGSNIDGEVSGDGGWAVSLSSDGHTVAIGAINNDGINGVDSGHVRVHTIKEEVKAPSYTVTVSGSPTVFYIDGIANPNLTFTSGESYNFDQSDPSNTGHTLVITSAVDSSVNLINYQTLYGTPGQPGAYTTFVATSDTVSYVSYEVYVSVPSLPAPVGDVYEVASISADVNDDTKTGTTDAQKRNFTRQAVSDMLSAYKSQLTGSKLLKLAAGTILPGFNIPASREITLRDARVTKTFNRDELANVQTYFVLNDNDTITLKSAADDSVTVTQIGTNFTVVTPAGTTNKVAGDTFEYDGLSLLFGSIVATLTLIPPVDMTLTAFDSAFVLTQQAILPDVSYALDVSAEITLTQQISASDLSGVFFFKTDEDITGELITDTSNVEYYLDRSQFTGGQATLNAMNGIVTTGYYGSNTTDHLGKDFLRDMAQQLFNTHFGVDLFTNEDAVVTDISGKSAVVAADIFTKMGNVDKTNTALSGPDVSYGYYTTDTDSSNTNLTREILNQLLTLAPGRFTDKTTLRLASDISGVYGMPFVTNDTISYKLSVTAHPDQNTTIATGKSGLGTRTYKVIFKVA